jgi:hypothetical protein
MARRYFVKWPNTLAQLIVNSGEISVILHYIIELDGTNKLSGIIYLGYIASFGETMAAAVFLGKGVCLLAMDHAWFPDILYIM